jgi:hypothetical protein
LITVSTRTIPGLLVQLQLVPLLAVFDAPPGYPAVAPTGGDAEPIASTRAGVANRAGVLRVEVRARIPDLLVTGRGGAIN